MLQCPSGDFMKKFVVEMHFHTSEVSSCAHVSAADGVHLLAESGYDALITTDHYTPDSFKKRRHLPWSEQVDWYLSGYEAAYEAGQKENVTVLPGMEIRFKEHSNDYLVFGIDRTFLLNYPDLYLMSLDTFSQLSREQGLLIYQAHPFRNNMTIANPDYLDGLEGINSNPRHNSRNTIAQAWANEHNLPIIAGSDFHQVGDQGSSRLIFPDLIRSNKDLTEALRSRQYQIVTA